LRIKLVPDRFDHILKKVEIRDKYLVPMQLSLLEFFPDLEKRIFLDVFACLRVEAGSNRTALFPMEGQGVPVDLKIRCNRQLVHAFPVGTVYKLDVRLVAQKNKKSYFSAVSSRRIFRALEFFEHNLELQNGVAKKANRVQFVRNTPGAAL
jgi:hypothetical protein